MSKRTGLVEEVIAIGVRLPWGIGVALSLTVYIALHLLASAAPAHPASAAELGAFAGRSRSSFLASAS